MTAFALHPRPTYRAVAKEQIRSVGLALKKEGILFVVFLLVLGVLSLAAISLHKTVHTTHVHAAHRNTPHVGVNRFPNDQKTGAKRLPLVETVETTDSNGFATTTGKSVDVETGPPAFVMVALLPIGIVAVILPLGLAGFIIPFGVWRSDDVARRTYHWAMPTARGPHTLIKTAVGWLWLMLALAVYVAFVAGLFTLGAHFLGTEFSKFQMPGRDWAWAEPFVATTFVYFLTSIAVIGSARPWRWIGGLPTLFAISYAFFAVFDEHVVTNVMKSILAGKYGLWQAMLGAGDVPDVPLSQWLTVLALWGGIVGVGVVLAAYHRSEANVG